MAGKVHGMLSQALALAVRWGWLAANRCDRLDWSAHRSGREEDGTLERLRFFPEATVSVGCIPSGQCWAARASGWVSSGPSSRR